MEQRFKIGDRVISLTNPLNSQCQPRIKGNEYTINKVMYCSSCGQEMVNIGPLSRTGNVMCQFDGSIINNGGFMMTRSVHFVKIDDIDIAIEELLKVEDYETCQILKDIKS